MGGESAQVLKDRVGRTESEPAERSVERFFWHGKAAQPAGSSATPVASWAGTHDFRVGVHLFQAVH